MVYTAKWAANQHQNTTSNSATGRTTSVQGMAVSRSGLECVLPAVLDFPFRGAHREMSGKSTLELKVEFRGAHRETGSEPTPELRSNFVMGEPLPFKA